MGKLSRVKREAREANGVGSSTVPDGNVQAKRPILHARGYRPDPFIRAFHEQLEALVKPVNDRYDVAYEDDKGALVRRTEQLDDPHHDHELLEEHAGYIVSIPRLVIGSRRLTFA